MRQRSTLRLVLLVIATAGILTACGKAGDNASSGKGKNTPAPKSNPAASSPAKTAPTASAPAASKKIADDPRRTVETAIVHALSLLEKMT